VNLDLLGAIVFSLLIGGFLALDLGILNRRAHVISPREALAWTAVWVTTAVAFGLLVTAWRGPTTGLSWFTGYLVEYSLSVDNVFVFTIVFAAFAVPLRSQHRVLLWGVLGALAMRLTLILLGASLIERAEWILLLFGVFLVLTGVRLGLRRGQEAHPERNRLVAFARRHLRVTDGYRGERFIVREGGALAVTPLFLALLTVEISDVIFAVDSIPAIFAISTDPFVVFTSNAFAILGLRSLYFLLADARERFRYLPLGLAVVLIFVGGKMLVGHWLPVSPAVSLAVILGVLAAAVTASWVADRRQPAAAGGTSLEG
jgi:tellurite resistance protein TerC